MVDIVRKLSSFCGVTVFADEAQAIYGFADDREVRPGEVGEPTFPERIRSGSAGAFRECELTDVHRTGSRRLLKIFSDTRRKVLTAAGETPDKLAEIRDEIISLAHGEAPRVDDAALAELEDAFILYRRRCDVLQTSSTLTQNGIAHRVRMSGLPVCLTPWIGAALSGHSERRSEQEHIRALVGRQSAWHVPRRLRFRSSAWASLVRLAGRTRDSRGNASA